MSLKELNPVVVQDYKNYLMTDIRMCNNTAVKTLKTFKTVVLYGIKTWGHPQGSILGCPYALGCS